MKKTAYEIQRDIEKERYENGYCIKCGADLGVFSGYCNKCGKVLESAPGAGGK